MTCHVHLFCSTHVLVSCKIWIMCFSIRTIVWVIKDCRWPLLIAISNPFSSLRAQFTSMQWKENCVHVDLFYIHKKKWVLYFLHFSWVEWPPGGGESWEEGGGLQCGGGWRERRNPGRERVENEQILWERRGVRGMGRGHHFGPHSGSYHNFHDEGPQRMSHPPKQSGGRQHHHRGRHRLAPR